MPWDRVNVCFHGVGAPARDLEEGEATYWLGSDLFHGVLDLAAGRQDLGLSFDDGNASDVEVALPALCERGLRAEFFPIAARIGAAGCVDGAALRQLTARGMSLGSHGMHHRPWRGLDDRLLDEELIDARCEIETESGAPISSVSCPLGSYDRRVLMRLRQLNYRRVYTSDRTRATSGAWLQPRYSIRNSDSLEDIRQMIQSNPNWQRIAVTAAKIFVKRWY